MKVGVVVPIAEGDGDGAGVPSWGVIRRFARRAESLGLDSLWVPDHLLPYVHAVGRTGAIHEAWTVLTALCASTSRVELGTLVVAVPFRNPALLAKMATTADEVSGGRLILGLGCGNQEAETVAFGYPWERRVARFEEALRIIVQLLRGETLTFEGRFFAVRDADLAPAPERRIPILIAAKGPRMLRLAARWADAWNTAWYPAPDERFAERIADLDAALAAEGRDPASIVRTAGMSGETGSASEVAAALRAFEERGIGHVIIGLRPPRTVASLERLAEGVETYRSSEAPVAPEAATPVSR